MAEFDGGRELTEYECYQWVIEGLRQAQEELRWLDRREASSFERLLRYLRVVENFRHASVGLRGLGHLRGDAMWQLAVRKLDDLGDAAAVLKGRRPVHGRLGPLVTILDRMVWHIARLKDEARAPLLWLPKRGA